MLDVLLGASGGVLGIVGALFKHGLEIYQEKKKEEASLAILVQTNAHELAMADKQANLIELEAKNSIALADINASKEVDVASYGAISASYDSDKATYSDAKQNGWMIAVDVCRGMIRPMITVLFSTALIWFTAWIWLSVPNILTSDPTFLKNTFYRLIDSLIFLGTSSVGWWFGSRGVSKSSSQSS
ncbi:MAG: hypothetical protein PHT07_20760 [Paludibacter sp.]|nr:hypothetical protein [Paludibacter sp.]